MDMAVNPVTATLNHQCLEEVVMARLSRAKYQVEDDKYWKVAHEVIWGHEKEGA